MIFGKIVSCNSYGAPLNYEQFLLHLFHKCAYWNAAKSDNIDGCFSFESAYTYLD